MQMLQIIEGFCRERCYCWPGNEALAEQYGCSVVTAASIVRDLERAGAVRRIGDRRGGRRKAIVLMVRADPDLPVGDPDNPDATDIDRANRGGRNPSKSGGATLRNRGVANPSKSKGRIKTQSLNHDEMESSSPAERRDDDDSSGSDHAEPLPQTAEAGASVPPAIDRAGIVRLAAELLDDESANDVAQRYPALLKAAGGRPELVAVAIRAVVERPRKIGNIVGYLVETIRNGPSGRGGFDGIAAAKRKREGERRAREAIEQRARERRREAAQPLAPEEQRLFDSSWAELMAKIAEPEPGELAVMPKVWKRRPLLPPKLEAAKWVDLPTVAVGKAGGP
jgi:hypothetical protein